MITILMFWYGLDAAWGAMALTALGLPPLLRSIEILQEEIKRQRQRALKQERLSAEYKDERDRLLERCYETELLLIRRQPVVRYSTKAPAES